MAHLTIRKPEVAKVVGILEADEGTYATSEEMAKAIVGEVYNLWRERSWWAVLHKYGDGPPIAFGLEATEAAARKFAAGLGSGKAALLHVASTEEFCRNVEQMDKDAHYKYDHLPCADCGHLEWLHGAVGWKGNSVQVPKNKACAMNCKCKRYRKPEGDDSVTTQ